MQHETRKGNMWWTALAAALLVCLAQANANAQQHNWGQKNYGGQSGVTVTDVRVAPTSNGNMLADIERRLATLESRSQDDAEAIGVPPPEGGEHGHCVACPIQMEPNHQIIGRMFVDQLWMDDLEGAVPQDLDNMTGFRDLRLGVQGNIWENLGYKVEFEFEGDEVDFKDVFAELTNLPWVGNFVVGHFKEPMGLEHLTSSRFRTFMEAAAATRDFAPDRNIGVMIYDYLWEDHNWSYYASLTRGNHAGDNLNTVLPQPPPDEDVDQDTNDWSFTARLAGTPYYDEHNGRCLFHCGVGYSARRTGQNPGTLGNGHWLGDLEMDDRTSLLNIQLNPGEEFNVYNFECAWMRGPFSLQGEYYYSETVGARGIYANGAYLQASYFLTGENRGYDRRMKAFYRVHPYEPFFLVNTCDGCSGGLGAWELAARWSWKDLDSVAAFGPIGGPPGSVPPTVIGTQENITVGCNWYLNPYSRVMFNYVHSISDYTFIGKSEGDHFGLRFQIDW